MLLVFSGVVFSYNVKQVTVNLHKRNELKILLPQQKKTKNKSADL